jgi:hypothetical protein
MRTPLLMMLGPLSHALAAQCTFTPTITPASPILCPNSSDLLSTQVYDSCQWYKDGAAIPGAVQQTLTVNAFNDGGSSFTVECTLNGCTELSSPVLVEGWVFQLPTVMHNGDAAYNIDPNGVSWFCEGDTLLLNLLPPYDASILWTDGGQPITGANGTTLAVTGSGAYSVSGAPSICPNYILPLGVTIEAQFSPVEQPVITPDGNDLCAAPLDSSYQWFLNGAPIAGANTACITRVGTGSCTVEVGYGTPCSERSDPFVVTGIDERATNELQLFPNPTRGALRVSWPQGAPLGNWNIVDATGREVLVGRFRGHGDEWIDLGGLRAGRYWLRPELGADWAPAAITVID